jgi:hypothetical protein
MPDPFPAILRSNAFTGSTAAVGELSAEARRWSVQNAPPIRRQYLADFETDVDLHQWEDERVGYGIVAAMPAGKEHDPASDADLSEAVRELIARRKAPLLRFSFDDELYLIDYRSQKGFEIAQSGIGAGALPQYLLILGGPEKIPWRIQFQLNSRRFVGRLPLEGADLDNYIRHLLSGWKDNCIDVNTPVVWSTDYGYPDITELMRKVVAQPLHAKYAGNSRILQKAALFEAESATRANLSHALTRSPGLIVTTSHGLVAPLDKPDQMPAQIGALVDQNRTALDSEQLLAGWQPKGAIWYAHACCSAGTDGARRYQDLVKGNSDLALTFAALTNCGPAVAPLPVRLLKAEKPARAFIGHVEPTFDCTLRNSDTGELFTKPIIDALYTQLLQQNPVGYAMQFLLGALASVNAAYLSLKSDFQPGDDAYARRLNYSLRGSDLAGTVLLGDPTAVLPKLA